MRNVNDKSLMLSCVTFKVISTNFLALRLEVLESVIYFQISFRFFWFRRIPSDARFDYGTRISGFFEGGGRNTIWGA